MKKNVILFGASRLGKAAYIALQGKYHIIGFCDNNKEKWGTFEGQLEVFTPEILFNLQADIIITSSYSKQIIEQLDVMGIRKFKVFRCYDANFLSNPEVNILSSDWFLESFGDSVEDKYIELDGEPMIETHCGNNNRKRIVFFVANGTDKFIDDIIDNLSSDYETKKVLVDRRLIQMQQIIKEMEWSDICWFEWCDAVTVFGSKLPLAKERKLICRLHRYEAFTDIPSQVNWNNVDKVIFVGDQIKGEVEKNTDLTEEKCIVIPNGINKEHFSFKERQKGYNIAYIGQLILRKNPMLILGYFNELLKIDNQFKLFFAGEFLDKTLDYYLKGIIRKLGLTDKIVFEGHIPNNKLQYWLEDKHFIVTGGISEGHPVGVMEAMCCGLKPAIHYFPGIEQFYPEKYIYSELNGFLKIFLEEDYNSKEYHDYICTNFSLDRQMQSIRKLLLSL